MANRRVPGLGQTETTASGVTFVRPLGSPDGLEDDKLQRYREEHPGEFVGWYVPKTGGYVIAIENIKAYRGPCKHCSDGVVTRTRTIPPGGDWHIGQGRWPEICDDCNEQRQQDHADRARVRMAELRRKRKAVRDEQFDRLGLPPVRQGLPMDGSPRRERCDGCGELDCDDAFCRGSD